MDESTLKRICMAGSILSLIGIFILCSMLQPLETAICGLSPEHRGRTVSVEGEVTEAYTQDGSVFFTLSRDGCEVKAVMWKDALSALSVMGGDVDGIKVNSTMKVSGDVEVYRGTLQIVVSRPSAFVM